ncbi:hypothetical protein ACFL0L_04460, partial [Patescibacteria group bacterium]
MEMFPWLYIGYGRFFQYHQVSIDKVKRKNRVSSPQPKLEIIEAKKDFVIINKPVGILVHPTKSS